jgi:predicted ATP-dependent protease
MARFPGAFGVVIEPPHGPIHALQLDAGRPYVIGRAPGDRAGPAPVGRLDVEDPTLSSAHARLEVAIDGVQLTDQGSAAGCWIGGARIASARLGVGASVLLGATTLTIVGAAEIEPDPRGSTDPDPIPGAIGRSLPMRSLARVVGRYAALSAPVMIRGESGAGKELVARALHVRSPRASGPFEAINVSTLTRELAESELFGHERGAFTGAATAREGLFERADGGTLFLDEIADLSADLQAKLLRVLETGETRRLGARAARRVDVRVVAATWAPLEQRVEEGLFREDLFHRIAVAPRARLRHPGDRDAFSGSPA